MLPGVYLKYGCVFAAAFQFLLDHMRNIAGVPEGPVFFAEVNMAGDGNCQR